MARKLDEFKDRNGEYLTVYENWHSVTLSYDGKEINLNEEQIDRLIQNLVEVKKRLG